MGRIEDRLADGTKDRCENAMLVLTPEGEQ